MKYNILICGLGSIGKRHADLLLQNYACSLFALRSNRDCKPVQDINFLYSWEEVNQYSFHAAFITNPTHLHVQTAIECAKRGINLFIEKPINDSLDKLDCLLKLVKERNLATHVGYNLRFHPMVRALRESLKGKKILHSRIVGTSFLPDWNKNSDYLKSYRVVRNRGGGVLLELSHEIDLSSFLIGPITKIAGVFGRRTSLTIDAEDCADLLLHHEDNSITNVHINFMSRKLQRYIEIDTEEHYFYGDLIASTIECKGKEEWKKQIPFNKDDMYLGQLDYFLKNLDNPKMGNNLFEAAPLFKKIVALREGQ